MIGALIAMLALLAATRLIHRLREDRDRFERYYESLKTDLYRLRHPQYWDEEVEEGITEWLMEVDDKETLAVLQAAGIWDHELRLVGG